MFHDIRWLIDQAVAVDTGLDHLLCGLILDAGQEYRVIAIGRNQIDEDARKILGNIVLLLCIAVCAIISFIPKRPYLDRTAGTIVQPFLALSSPLRFPLARIDIKDMPEGLMENLSVINHGCLNIFGIYSGIFRCTRDKSPVYIYIRNRRHGLIYFEYDGRRYIINQWE